VAGAAALTAAGIAVESGVEAELCARASEAWLTAVRRGRPFVTWKYAASLDGRAAAADGSSQWITGPDARADGHKLRSQSDAVIVGSGTVLADDCHLTVRHGGRLADKQPLRVVVDTHARTAARREGRRLGAPDTRRVRRRRRPAAVDRLARSPTSRSCRSAARAASTSAH
jgi:diaminohydroxyphosphoribosylaminopyrimidine deaminase/5-amino-6-(5-phosphoribosylamino)uracil reductase